MADQPTTSPANSNDGTSEGTQESVGVRELTGLPLKAVLGLCLIWSLFQLWYASPLPFMTGILALNSTQARALHLGFAILLAYLLFPARKGQPQTSIPPWDIALALIAAFCATYLYTFYDQLAQRPGSPTHYDVWVAGIGMVLLLEATRRALGPPLMVVAIVFLGYTFFGSSDLLPDVIRWQGASLERAASHFWLTTEGVFGVALGVSTSFVFLFVLFGSLLDRAGGGNYFIQVAFSLLGHMRGGPAKASVVASGLTGLISGSSIANTVTTGTFTIPLMKKVGFSSDKAGAVEVGSSVNGQLMPPVMGAAAFLMVEYVGIPYVQVIKHAILPAVISYIALIYIVHLEAVKLDLRGLPKPSRMRPMMALASFGTTLAGVIILAFLVYYGLGWIRTLFGGYASLIIAALVIAAYIAVIAYGARQAELSEDPDDMLKDGELPPAGPIIKGGLHFLLPVVILVWCLVVERLSPSLSAFYAAATMIAIQLTQRPIFAFFRGHGDYQYAFLRGARDLLDGLILGGRNMIGIGVATATAGFVVGTVSLTGIGQVMTDFVAYISAGNFILVLIFTAVISLLLGMGLPTTANYIVVSTLMAPVVMDLAGQAGLVVPLIAVHMFVFYFGIMADVTPPVGLAAFAASAISRGDPIRTGLRAFYYSLRTVILPFLFIFNTQLLLIDVPNWFSLGTTVVTATIAMLVFAAALQGYFFARCRWWEIAVLLLVAFSLFRPDYWMDRIVPPTERDPAQAIESVVAEIPDGGELRLQLRRETMDGRTREVQEVVQLPAGDSVADRLAQVGIERLDVGEERVSAEAAFMGELDDPSLVAQFEILELRRPVSQPPQELIHIPSLIVLTAVVLWQRRRVHGRALAPLGGYGDTDAGAKPAE